MTEGLTTKSPTILTKLHVAAFSNTFRYYINRLRCYHNIVCSSMAASLMTKAALDSRFANRSNAMDSTGHSVLLGLILEHFVRQTNRFLVVLDNARLFARRQQVEKGGIHGHVQGSANLRLGVRLAVHQQVNQPTRLGFQLVNVLHGLEVFL